MNIENECIIERITKLLDEQKKTQKELTDYLGLGRATFSHWKNDNRKSYFQYIPQISEFLQTTPNYILLGDTGTIELTNSEVEILQMIRKTSVDQREIIKEILKNFLLVDRTNCKNI